MNTPLFRKNLETQFSVQEQVRLFSARSIANIIRELTPSLNRKTFCVTLHISYMLIISQKKNCHFVSSHFELENDVKMTPKRRSYPRLIFGPDNLYRLTSSNV